jgi:outer membrane biosynthesis protein TonB
VTPFSKHTGQKSAEQIQFELRKVDDSISAGMILSCGGHALLIAAIVFGLPIFWAPEPLPGAIGIELAQLSDITAAPKVQQEGKPNKQPAPEPEVKKEEPKKETPPPPPNPPAAAAPPPPPPPEEEVAEAIPDPLAEKKKEEERKKEEDKKKAEAEKKRKKEEEKKKKEEEKKKQKKDDAALDTLLANVLDNPPAPEAAPEKPKKKNEAKPAEPSTGPMTEQTSEIPMTASEEDGIRGQIEGNWNKGSFSGAPNIETMVIELRIHLQPDGTVTKAEVLNNDPNPYFQAAAGSAVRAAMISSPLRLPPGKTWDTIKLVFHP